MNNKSDEVEVLKKRIDDLESQFNGQRPLNDNSKVANLLVVMIGLIIVAFGVFFIIKHDLYAGLIIILIGVQFLT